jgi:predicted amidohydrolase
MKVTIATAQYPITEHNTFNDWQIHTENWIENAIEQGAELLLFPEYGSMELVSLFEDSIRNDIKQQLIELKSLEIEFCNTFRDLAIKYQVIIVAPSFPVNQQEKIFNRVYVFSPEGQVGYQDKFFMTRFENEEWSISSAPKQLTVFKAPWGNFGIQICYDVEFPIGSQLLATAGVNLLLAPSCTETIRGATRVHIGARARALENQCYVAVSQTINNADWSPAVDINFGYTAIYCPPDKGLPEEGIVAIQKPQTEGWLIETLDFELINKVRADGQVLNLRDSHAIQSKFLKEDILLKFVNC